MKRRVGLLLLVVMILGWWGFLKPVCSFKIGLVTGTVSQGEEEYRAGEKMAARYPGSVIHVTYPDNFMQEQETTMTQIVRLEWIQKLKPLWSVKGYQAPLRRLIGLKSFGMTWC